LAEQAANPAVNGPKSQVKDAGQLIRKDLAMTDEENRLGNRGGGEPTARVGSPKEVWQ
jgi:hypothetical protein